MNVKPTLMRHAEEYQRGQTRGIEERAWAPRHSNHHHAFQMGRTAMGVRCPFCSGNVTITPNGVARGGQRCGAKECQAIFVTGGKAYRLMQETSDAE